MRFDFLCNFCLIPFLFLRINRRAIFINVHTSLRKVPVILVSFFKKNLEFSVQIFGNYSNVRFHENDFIGG
jgi:hypothetical protein